MVENAPEHQPNPSTTETVRNTLHRWRNRAGEVLRDELGLIALSGVETLVAGLKLADGHDYKMAAVAGGTARLAGAVAAIREYRGIPQKQLEDAERREREY